MGYCDVETPKTGDVVEPGIYTCIKCGEQEDKQPYTIILEKEGKLPMCKDCGFTVWLKI